MDESSFWVDDLPLNVKILIIEKLFQSYTVEFLKFRKPWETLEEPSTSLNIVREEDSFELVLYVEACTP